MEEADEYFEQLLGSDPPPPPGRLARDEGGYRDAVDCVPPPVWVTLERIMAERVDLYCYVPFMGEDIPVSVELFPLEESVPTEDKIEWVVKRLHNHRSRGPSGIQAEHIKGWLAEARK